MPKNPRNVVFRWGTGVAGLLCLAVVGCVAQQADVVRVKRQLNAKIAELDKSKLDLQQAVAEANQALEKANAIIAHQRTEIQELVRARADLVDQVTTLKESDLSAVRGELDEHQHLSRSLEQKLQGLKGEVKRVRTESLDREQAVRKTVEQLEQQVREQGEILTTQSDKISEFRASLLDFQHVLTAMREDLVQQGERVRRFGVQAEGLERKQSTDARVTAANLDEIKKSIQSVVTALEKVSNTLAGRLDEHERRLTQVSSKADHQRGGSQGSAGVPDQRKGMRVTQSFSEIRNQLSQIHTAPPSSSTPQRPGASPAGSFLPPPSPDSADEPSPGSKDRLPTSGKSPDRAELLQSRLSPQDDREEQAYRRYLALLQKGDIAGALTGFRGFLARYPDSPLASNAQYWLGECYYAKRDFNQAIQEFRQVFTRYPSSEKVPAALLKIGYSHIELEEGGTARAVFRHLVKAYPDSPEALKAYARLTEVGSPAHNAS